MMKYPFPTEPVPENIPFAEEPQERNHQELAEYEQRFPMTPAEKRALRKWVASGHSPYEHPGSRYLCLEGTCPPPDFLDVYRMDREIKHELAGKSKAEKAAYLKAYTGRDEETDNDGIDRSASPAALDHIHEMERERFHIWEFLYKNMDPCGLEELRRYVDEHKDDPIPFEW